jgi:alpha-1,2-mannosyltransferase
VWTHSATHDDERRIWWQRVAWIALAISCLSYLTISLVHGQAFHPFGRKDYFDLRVYRGAGNLILNSRPLYAGPIWRWAPFTYPPCAAILFAPMARLPLAVDELFITALGVMCLFGTLACALRLGSEGGPDAAQSRGRSSAVLAIAVAGALWLEPITSTLGYGQVNLLIAFLIVSDLGRRDSAKSKGVMIGIAAGLKLTPLIFVPYLFLSGRRRAGCVALVSTASTVALGYLLLPGDSRRFWGGLFLDPGRVGGCCIPSNQSLRGAILHTAPSLQGPAVVVVALLVGAAGLALAVRASRRGDEALGFSLCALTGLLVSPVSWTHHWTLAVPVLLLLGVRAFRRRSRVGLAAFAVALLVGYSYLPTLMASTHPPRKGALGALWTLASAPYVLLALGALAAAFLHETRGWRQPAWRLERLEPARQRVAPVAALPLRRLRAPDGRPGPDRAAEPRCAQPDATVLPG